MLKLFITELTHMIRLIFCGHPKIAPTRLSVAARRTPL
jgi:hypothetical protein